MVEPSNSWHGVMEGEGAYNRYAQLAAGGAQLAMPFLKRAAESVALDPGPAPIVIADYGSSQGRNSLAPIGAVIQCLRSRTGTDRPISIFHVDQPRNDFNSLFDVLHSDPGSYVLNQPNVFPCAAGRSFYEQVLPPDSVHFGWSSYSAQWLSRIPTLIPGHFFAHCSTGTARAEFERQAARDWETFLSLRSRELKPGGRLLLVLPGYGDSGSTGFEPGMDHANAALAEMVEEGAITAEEKSEMVIGGYIRTESDLLAPFVQADQFRGLRVEECETFPLPDITWHQYEQDGDAEALARKRALFFRTVFMPSLASALMRVRLGDTAALRAFADRLQCGMIRRLKAHPAPARTFVQVMVLAKYSDSKLR